MGGSSGGGREPRIHQTAPGAAESPSRRAQPAAGGAGTHGRQSPSSGERSCLARPRSRAFPRDISFLHAWMGVGQ